MTYWPDTSMRRSLGTSSLSSITPRERSVSTEFKGPAVFPNMAMAYRRSRNQKTNVPKAPVAPMCEHTTCDSVIYMRLQYYWKLTPRRAVEGRLQRFQTRSRFGTHFIPVTSLRHVVARHTRAMTCGVFQRQVVGRLLVLQDEVVADNGGDGRAPAAVGDRM